MTQQLPVSQGYLPDLNDFQVTQLRELLIAFTKSPEEIPRHKSELLEKLNVDINSEDLIKLVAKLEATQVFKHIFLYALPKRDKTSEIQKRLASRLAEATASISDGIGLSFLDTCLGEYLALRMVHYVTNRYYISTGPYTQSLHSRSFRHPVVIAIKPEIGIVEVRFNGFEQSRDTPASERIKYDLIAEECRAFVQTLLEVEVSALPLKDAVEKLLIEFPKEVSQVKGIGRFGNGRVSIDTGDSDDTTDMVSYIKEAFKLNENVSPVEAMQHWTAEHMTLRWNDYKIQTRIDFTGITPELLFFWRGAEKAIKNSDAIIKRLIEFAPLEYSNVRQRVIDFLQRIDDDKIYTPLEISQKSNAALEDALAVLLDPKESHRYELRFRVKTVDQLLDFSNVWRKGLVEFPPVVTTEADEKLDLQNNENIEVGFAIKKVSQ